ncbi:MAG: patatin-like phospholipase family protein [Bacteroidales bacterium]|jgi:NTE family protein|nr:patatin-like phospholipase family protein [Bacteroidales bacterium]
MKCLVTICLLSLLCISGLADDNTQCRHPRVGLVLSGGGAKGFAHIGVLKVLEEVGMPVDYIAGTSMGSIVGGLYALGYTAQQLETYAKETDWNNLLTDRISRRNVMIYEKGERKKYWLQFPISGHKINLPIGLLSGQNISNLFTKLASPAYDQTDFSQFPIPFLCVATDIRTGEEVVLESGQLPVAMRASMAIPSVFTPVSLNGKMLFDGGLVNNLPVDKLKDKGIDILIGVDVSAQTQTSESENMYRIAEQVVFMASTPLKEANKHLCKVLIMPDVNEFRFSSFNAVDTLIERGEKSARRHYDELKALADSLRLLGQKPERTVFLQPLPALHVKEIVVTGLENISQQYVLQKSGLVTGEKITFDQLDKAVERLKGTQMFESIVYHILPSYTENEVNIQFDFVEAGTNLFRVGLHYDKEYQAALLLNVSFRNLLLNNSHLLMDLSIGENPSLLLTYLHNPGVSPFGKSIFNTSLFPEWMFQINVYQRSFYNYVDNRKADMFDCLDIVPSVSIQFTPSVNTMIGMRLSGEYSTVSSQFVSPPATKRKSDNLLMSWQLYYEWDTYNEDYFPTSGSFFHLEGNYHRELSKNVHLSEKLLGFMFRSNFALSPTRRWTFHIGADAGAILGNDIPLQYLLYAGGLPNKLYRYEFRFTGMDFRQQSAKNMMLMHWHHQIRLWNNVYVTLRTHVGKMDNVFAELLTPRSMVVGYGVSTQYNSIVGPLGFTLSSSNLHRSLLAVFHMGFWF